MKKLISVLLCVAIALCIVPTAQAAEVAETKQTTVSLELDPTLETYTLTIPATVSIDPSVKTGTIAVSLSNVELIWHSVITITMSAANTASDETYSHGAYLVNTEDSTKKIHYEAKSKMEGAQLTANRDITVINFEPNFPPDYDSSSHTETGEVYLNVDGAYPGSGTYTDTLTFTVELS